MLPLDGKRAIFPKDWVQGARQHLVVIALDNLLLLGDEEIRQLNQIDYHYLDIWGDGGLVSYLISAILQFQVTHFIRRGEALQTSERELPLDPDDPASWRGLGENLIKQHRFEEALVAFDQGLKINQQDPDLWMGLAIAQFETKRIDAALMTLKQGLNHFPHDPYLLHGMGIALFARDRFEEALVAFDRSLEFNHPEIHILLRDRGDTLAKLDRSEEALAAYERGLELNNKDHHTPNGEDGVDQTVNLSLLKGRARMLRNIGSFEEALEVYDRGLKIYPQDPYLSIGLGEMLLMDHRHEMALTIFDRGLQFNQIHPGLLGGRGEALRRCRRFAEAYEAFESSLAIEPTQLNSHLGICLLLQNNPTKPPPGHPSAPRTLWDAIRRLVHSLQDLGDSDYLQMIREIIKLTDNLSLLRPCLISVIQSEGERATRDIGSFLTWVAKTLKHEIEQVPTKSVRIADCIAQYSRLLVRLLLAYPLTDPRRTALEWCVRSYVSIIDECLNNLPSSILQAVMESDREELVLSLVSNDKAAFEKGRAEHAIMWLSGAPNDPGRAKLLLQIETRLWALAMNLRLFDQSSNPQPDERNWRLEGIHQSLEMLPSYELDRTALRRHSKSSMGISAWFARLLPAQNKLMTIDAVQTALGDDKILFRAYRFQTLDEGPAVLLFVIQPGEAPFVDLRQGKKLAEAISKIDTIDELLRHITAIPGCLDSEVEELFAKRTKHNLNGDVWDTIVALTDEALLGLSMVFFDGVLTVESLKGKHLLISPPVRWMALPWLALPGPKKNTRRILLGDLVASLKIVPVLSLPTIDKTEVASLGLISNDFLGERESRLACLKKLPGNLPAQVKSIPGDFEERPYTKEFYNAIVNELNGNHHIHILSHLTWNTSVPSKKDTRFDLCGLVPHLADQNVNGLYIKRLILESCNSGRVLGDIGEHFQSLTLAFLAAGVQEVLASGYAVVPEHQGRPFFDLYYKALIETGDMAVAATRAARMTQLNPPESSDLYPYIRLPSYWAAFQVVSRFSAMPVSHV